MSTDSQLVLQVLHFNDVYNVDEQTREPLGGVARFCTAMEHFRDDRTLTIFGGDALSPSTLSTQTKGLHMMEFLNALKVDCAVYGNHDFDFGKENLVECATMSQFPWLLSNCTEVETGLPLADGKLWHIVDKFGVRFGFLGLIEPEWVDTLSMVDSEDVLVADFCEVGATMAQELRETHGCHVIIALTHMRWPNDLRLAQEVPGIDLVLGGHDHNAGLEVVEGRAVVKSGADFREFSRLELTICMSSQPRLVSTRLLELVTVDSRWAPDPTVAAQVSNWTADMNAKLAEKIGEVEVELECRFDVLRRRECNLGNWIADIILTAVDADVAVLNAGTLRADTVFPAGPFTHRDLSLLLPFVTTIVVQRVTGRQLIEVLENGVSQLMSVNFSN